MVVTIMEKDMEKYASLDGCAQSSKKRMGVPNLGGAGRRWLQIYTVARIMPGLSKPSSDIANTNIIV